MLAVLAWGGWIGRDHHRSLGVGLLQGPTGGVATYQRGTPVDMTDAHVFAPADEPISVQWNRGEHS